ncbi:MAG: helix-turn-helix domain-containing protein [Chloroflexota bacterium]
MNHQEARRRWSLRLRNIRKQKNITQEQLAELIGKSTEHISFLERGERSPSFEVIVDIANALDVPVSNLMNMEEPTSDSDLIETLGVAPIAVVVDPINNDSDVRYKQQSDLERLESAIEGIREMQRLADEYGIQDILQDNGGKVLQVLILLGLRISPGREGNDAVDNEGNEYELKTINRALNKNAGVTTHHHLNRDIIEKYRSVKAWYVAMYESIELVEIYRVEPSVLEPLFQEWEKRVLTEGPLNNPKISINKYVKKGDLVYPKNAPKQGKLSV